jgi:hypothetical protein
MAAYTWTKFKCMSCGQEERYRGKPYNSTLCTTCKAHGVYISEIHWGHEEYAGVRAGTIEKFSSPGCEENWQLKRSK